VRLYRFGFYADLRAPKSHCGLISHDVANLDAANPRRAYWCKSDIEGYLDEERAGHLPRHRGR
jgi:hypothetical protein